MSDLISRQAAIDKFIDGLEKIFADIRERHVDDSVCGLCEYDGAYLGQSGDWCNECPGFEKDDCFKLSDKIRKKWTDEIIKALPSAHTKLDEWCTDCKEYDHERHCCPRYNRVIRESLAEISITRCKDCKHWKVSQNNTCGIQICYLFGGVREEYDYCSRGEKA